MKVHFNRPEHDSQRVIFVSDVMSAFRQENSRVELGLCLELQDLSDASMDWNSQMPCYFLDFV